jgi:hypothetical protein
MFIAVALMCQSMNLSDCSMMISEQVFINEAACVEFRDAQVMTTGPQGLIVGAACFKIPGEEA